MRTKRSRGTRSPAHSLTPLTLSMLPRRRRFTICLGFLVVATTPLAHLLRRVGEDLLRLGDIREPGPFPLERDVAFVADAQQTGHEVLDLHVPLAQLAVRGAERAELGVLDLRVLDLR